MIDDIENCKKKRKTNPSEPNAHELRSAATSQHKQSYLVAKGLEESIEQKISNHIRARKAKAIRDQRWFELT
jgi:hypothetical protein